jgi:hypothetical protein
MMLRPGILHRDEARFKALIRKELQKREQQSQQGVAEAFPNPGSGSTGSSKEDKRIAAALRKKHIPTTPNNKKEQGVAESNTLMKKLQRAMVKEGRVKELADDLKTLNDTEFMKKYGKAKAAIRKDMKKLDENASLAPYLQKDADGSQYYNLPTTNPNERGAGMGKTNISPAALAQIKSPQGQQQIIKQLLAMTSKQNAVPQATATSTDVSDQYAGGLEEADEIAPAQPGVAEARTSAAQRLSTAWDRQRAKSDASLARTPGSIPKKQEPKKADPAAKTVSEHRVKRQALMAQMLNGH